MLPLNKHTKIILDLSKQRLSNCGTIYDNLIQMKHDLQKYITIKFNILKINFILVHLIIYHTSWFFLKNIIHVEGKITN